MTDVLDRLTDLSILGALSARRGMLALALACACLAGAALAAEERKQEETTPSLPPLASPDTTQSANPDTSLTANALGQRARVPASQLLPRNQRSFRRCNVEAMNRRYRGAERRHFVARCKLGYGRRLFRRRTS